MPHQKFLEKNTSPARQILCCEYLLHIIKSVCLAIRRFGCSAISVFDILAAACEVDAPMKLWLFTVGNAALMSVGMNLDRQQLRIPTANKAL